MQISAGGDHTCALLETGGLLCWGLNDADQATPPPRKYTQVAVGARHVCSITSQGGWLCWGSNSDGQSNTPAIPPTVGKPRIWDAGSSYPVVGGSAKAITISAGGNRSCGSVRNVSKTSVGYSEVCWGAGESGAWSTYVEHRYTRETRLVLGSGIEHTCWNVGDNVRCFGDNAFGQTNVPAGEFVHVSVGGYHNCAMTSAGAVSCWGSNLYEQATPPGGRYSFVTAGEEHSCAVHISGSIRCWGRNNHGQTDAPGDTDWEFAAAGGSHSCAVNDNGKVTCWGRNNHRQLNVPAAIAATPTVLRHTVSVTASPANAGTVSGYGDLLHGSTATLRATPAEGYRFVRWIGDASGTSTLVRIVVDEDKTVFAVFEPVGAGPDETPMISDGTMTADFPAGRIVARRLDDGRTEFGYQPNGGDRVLPSSRYFPANATVDRWLNSSPVIVDGEEIGRINARLLADGRIEFAFTPADGERILPATRYFPVSSSGGWLRSSLIGG